VTVTRGLTATPDGARPAKKGPRNPFARAGLFIRQVMAELRKVIWPTRNQMLTYWAVVLVFVLAIIGIVSVLDLFFGWIMFEIFS